MNNNTVKLEHRLEKLEEILREICNKIGSDAYKQIDIQHVWKLDIENEDDFTYFSLLGIMKELTAMNECIRKDLNSDCIRILSRQIWRLAKYLKENEERGKK